MRPTKLVLSLGVLTVMMAVASAADAAQACAASSDCPHGFVCEIYETTVPPTAGCTKDAPCPDAKPVASALVAVAGSCVPAACATDTDCGTDMLCHSETREMCSGGTSGACAPDTKCEPVIVSEPVCTKETVSSCVYRWELPCQSDSDCGAAFTCVPSPKTICPTRKGGGPTPSGAGGSDVGGSAGTPTKDDPSTAPPGDAAECTTTPAFPGTCQPKATTCNADTDCPSAWTCIELPTPGAGAGTGGSPGSSDGSPGSSDGSLGSSDGSTGSSDGSTGSSDGSTGSSDGGTGVSGGGTTTSDAPAPTDPSKVTPTLSPAVDGGTTPPATTVSEKVCVSPFGGVGRDGTTTLGGSASEPALPPTGEKGAAAQDSSHAESPSAGCTVVANTGGDLGSSVVAGLALMGLTLVSRRRGARR